MYASLSLCVCVCVCSYVCECMNACAQMYSTPSRVFSQKHECSPLGQRVDLYFLSICPLRQLPHSVQHRTDQVRPVTLRAHSQKTHSVVERVDYGTACTQLQALVDTM